MPIPPSGLRWYPVVNSEARVEQKLILISPQESQAIEGFGVELDCFILNEPVAGIFSRKNQCKIRKVSTLVVEEEKQRLAELGSDENYILEGLEAANEFVVQDEGE